MTATGGKRSLARQVQFHEYRARWRGAVVCVDAIKAHPLVDAGRSHHGRKGIETQGRITALPGCIEDCLRQRLPKTERPGFWNDIEAFHLASAAVIERAQSNAGNGPVDRIPSDQKLTLGRCI